MFCSSGNYKKLFSFKFVVSGKHKNFFWDNIMIFFYEHEKLVFFGKCKKYKDFL